MLADDPGPTTLRLRSAPRQAPPVRPAAPPAPPLPGARASVGPDASGGPAAGRLRHDAGAAPARPHAGRIGDGGDPELDAMCRGFAVAVVETLHGIRPLAQLSRWLRSDVYASLQRRAELAARIRRGNPRAVPAGAYRAGGVVSCRPAPGALEAAVVVSGPDRVRAVALRLEPVRGRWMVTDLTVG